MFFQVLNFTVFALARLFIRSVNGKKNIPKKGPLIIVANHDSYIDPFIMCAIAFPILKEKVHFIVMKGRFWNKFGDKVSRKWSGCIPVDEGKEKTMEISVDLLKKGEIMGLFPGGPRSLDGLMPKGKTGAVRLALAANAPILPIGIVGAYEIAPREKLLPRLKRCEVNIGKPIYFKTGKKITKRLLRSLTEEVMIEIAKLSKKKYNPK